MSSWMVVSTRVRGRTSGASHSFQLQGVDEIVTILVDRAEKARPFVKAEVMDVQREVP